MNTLYLVMETVDLGGHPVIGFFDKQKAEADVEARNVAYKAQKRRDLMNHCNYTEQQADEFVSYCHQFYLEEVEIAA